jgi:hypothetical protein
MDRSMEGSIDGSMDRWIDGSMDGTLPAMPLMKLQTDIDYELIQKLEKHKVTTGKSKAAIVAQALREYFERQEDPEPTPHLAAVPARFRDASGQNHPAIYNSEASTLQIGPAAPADLFPEDKPEGEESTPALRNVEPGVITNDSELIGLRERLKTSKSGKEIDELTQKINQIETARTLAILNALPGADPAYVASRERGETT